MGRISLGKFKPLQNKLRFLSAYDSIGSLICQELLAGMNVPVEVGGQAEPRTAEYYKKRSCADMVEFAARIIENYLYEQGKL